MSNKNLFDPEVDNFKDTKRLNNRPKIFIALILTVLLTLLLFVILNSESPNSATNKKQGLEVSKKDSAYNSDDDFVKNLASRSKQNNQEEEQPVEDFREALIKEPPPFSSRTEGNGEKQTEEVSLTLIPISMLNDNVTILDKDDTYASVHLTYNEIITFRQKRIDELSNALKSNIRVYSGDPSKLNTVSASTSSTSLEGSNTAASKKMSYQEQLQQALAATQQSQSTVVSQKGEKWKLENSVEKPNPYTIKTGAIIPATLLTEVNSTVQGTITGQVRNNVYDTATGNQLLIPQGTRLVGTYASEVPYGQSRLFISWNRLVFPNGASLDIGEMPGVDMTGKAGFNDKVNNHYLRIFGNALLLSLIVAGVNVSQTDILNDFIPSYLEGASSAISESVGQNLGETMSQMVRKNLNIAPELIIRTGYLFNIMVVKDITLPTYK